MKNGLESRPNRRGSGVGESWSFNENRIATLWVTHRDDMSWTQGPGQRQPAVHNWWLRDAYGVSRGWRNLDHIESSLKETPGY